MFRKLIDVNSVLNNNQNSTENRQESSQEAVVPVPVLNSENNSQNLPADATAVNSKST